MISTASKTLAIWLIISSIILISSSEQKAIGNAPSIADATEADLANMSHAQLERFFRVIQLIFYFLFHFHFVIIFCFLKRNSHTIKSLMTIWIMFKRKTTNTRCCQITLTTVENLGSETITLNSSKSENLSIFPH